jgi:hypothetical protein
VLGPADLVREGDRAAPFLAGSCANHACTDHARRQAGSRDLVREASDRLDEGAFQRAGDDEEMGRVARVAPVLRAGQVLLDELLELLLLLFVTCHADAKRRPQAHCVISGAGYGEARDTSSSRCRSIGRHYG